MKKHSTFNAAAYLTAGQVVGQGLSFARNLLLARYLTKADFGLAATFALTIGLMELTGRLALGIQVVQAKDGNTEEFQRNTHAFQLAAGVTSAALVWLSSGLMAGLLNVPGESWAFALLAFVPLLMGMEHLDTYRYKREMRFGPGVLCELIPQVIVTVAIWPLLLWLKDFRVILWAMIGKAALNLVLTHVLAERKYGIAFDRIIATRIIAFSTPMLINGLFLFVSQQADRLIIGSQYSVAELARYAVPASILMVPWILFARVVGPLMISLLAGVQEKRELFGTKFQLCLEISSVATVLATLPLIVSGEQLAVLLFGQKYAGCGALMALLAVASAFRYLRTAPTAAAMALGDTRNLMWSNIFRSISLPLALGAAIAGLRIEWIAGAAIVGELAALIASFILVGSHHALPVRLFSRSLIFTSSSVAMFIALFVLGAGHLSIVAGLGASAVLTTVALGIALWYFPKLRNYLKTRWQLHRKSRLLNPVAAP
jgi:O-antigen/teichoic acid export membrane protein